MFPLLCLIILDRTCLDFKANTDDARDSPAIEVSKMLSDQGAQVVVYDPLAKGDEMSWLKMVESPLVACEGASALLVLTEWPEFTEADPNLVKAKLTSSPFIFDTRRVLDPKKWAAVFSNFKVTGKQ
jgi:UDPglucose 6-dehydrogenase